MLRVNGDAFAMGEVFEIDTMAAPVEAQFNAIMHQTFTLKPLSYAHFGQKIDCALLQNAGAHTFFHVLAAAIFNHDGIDPVEI